MGRSGVQNRKFICHVTQGGSAAMQAGTVCVCLCAGTEYDCARN